MKNRVTVTVAGQEYTLVAPEEEAYLKKVADHVDGQIRSVLENSNLSLTDASVLASLNIADTYFKEISVNDDLRRQIKDLLEESAHTKLELSEAKREIFRLQNRK